MPPTQNITQPSIEQSHEQDIKQEIDSEKNESNSVKDEIDNVPFPNVSVGHSAYFKNTDGRCLHGEVVAKRKLYEYIVKNSKTEEVEIITPEDVMSIDCCNLGPPPNNTEIEYYDCSNEKTISAIMLNSKTTLLYCFQDQFRKQYQIGIVTLEGELQ